MADDYTRAFDLGFAEAKKEAADEIERLTEAKRRALAIADERSKENVALRAALKPFAEMAKRYAPYPADMESNLVDPCCTLGHLRAAARAYEQKT